MKWIALALTFSLGACATTLSDDPDITSTVALSWDLVGDCIYNDLVTNQQFPPDRVRYNKAQSSRTSVVTVSDRNAQAGIIFHILAASNGTIVRTFAETTVELTSFITHARTTLRNCGVPDTQS